MANPVEKILGGMNAAQRRVYNRQRPVERPLWSAPISRRCAYKGCNEEFRTHSYVMHGITGSVEMWFCAKHYPENY